MATKPKLKLFSKLGGGHKKSKGLRSPATTPDQQRSLEIEISEDYCIPPDCDADADLYCEPADSLTVVSSLGTSPTRSISSQHSHQSQASQQSQHSSKQTTESPADSGTTVSADNQQLNGEASTPSTITTQQTVTADAKSSMSCVTVSEKTAGTDGLLTHDYYNQDAITRARVAANSAADSPSSSLYMNESQLRLEGLKMSQPRGSVTGPSQLLVTPQDDPRNLPSGDEYECPWDLRDTETEIYELVKQVKQEKKLKQSISSTTTEPDPHTNQTLNNENNSKPQRQSSTSSIQVFDTHSSNPIVNSRDNQQHTRQPKTKRLSSTSSLSSAVLVEGEWREAKTNLAHTPSTLELSCSPLIIPQVPASVSLQTQVSNNAASNMIYDHNTDDTEIQAKLSYTDDRPKVPCAQPRRSVSTSPGSSPHEQDNFYQNCSDTKKRQQQQQDLNSGFYEDPWNTDKVQQNIMNKIQQQQAVRRERKSSEDFSMSSMRGAEKAHTSTSSSRHSSSHMGSSKVDKLSPRALSGAGLHKPVSAPPVPKSGPGQAHANKTMTNKPILVVHKTNNVAVVPPSLERRDSGNRGSLRKNPPGPEVLECQHRVGLAVNKNLPLTQQPWYHGAIQRHYAEEVLRKAPDGSFLIRDTTGSSRDKTLSLKNSSGFIHIKIVQQMDGTYILGQFSHPFKNVTDMVEYYSRHKVNIKGAEHTYLEIPMLREL